MVRSTVSDNTNQNTDWLEELEFLGQASQPHLPVGRLYRQQRHAARSIAEAIRHLAMHASRADDMVKATRKQDLEMEASGQRSNPVDRGQPNPDEGRQDMQRHVFVLDGARGSGKSTALHTIQELIKNDAVVIEVPDSLLDQERPMEAILAEIERDLTLRRKNAKDDDRRATLERFLDRLRQDVHVGWTLAHGEGRTALLNDTLDFTDYVRARAKYNVQGYGRVDAWHSFIKDWLKEVHEKPLLALIFDDTDLDPDAGRKTLEDIRLYLSHARIVVILAADVQMMRRTLIRQTLAQHDTYTRTVGKLVTNKEGMDEIFRLLAEDVDVKLRGLFQKLLPSRFRLETDGRKDLERLFVLSDGTGPTLSELFVGQYAREAVDGKVFSKPSQTSEAEATGDAEDVKQGAAPEASGNNTAQQQESRKNALQWWFANAAYSALFLGNIRAIVRFTYALYFGPDRSGNMPDFSGLTDRFPRAGAESALTVLFRYHQGPVLARHGTGDRGLLQAVADREVLRGWRVEDDDPLTGEGARTESRMVDYWFDVRLAAAYLEPDWGVAELWLPYHWGGRDLRGTDRTRARLGVAAFYPDHPLPWSCLYVYQLRHLDSCVEEAEVGGNYNSMWDDPEDMSDQFAIAQDFLATRNAKRRIRKAMRGATDTSQWRALNAPMNYTKGRMNADSDVDFVKNNSVINFGRALVASLELYSKLLSILWDSRANEKDIQDSLLNFIENGRNFAYYSSVFDVFDALEESWSTSFQQENPPQPNTGSHLIQFLKELFYLARSQEDCRRHYMSMWVSAARLASLGNDFDSIAFFRSAPNPQGDISYQIDDAERPPAVSRMERLAKHALDLIADNRSRRTVILHAWSLVPIVHGLAKVDDANIDLVRPTGTKGPNGRTGTYWAVSQDSRARKAWEDVRDFLQQAFVMLLRMKPRKATVPMTATLTTIRENVANGNQPVEDRTTPEGLIDPIDVRYWCFADFSDEDLFGNKHNSPSIKNDIKGAIRHLKESMEAYESTYNTLTTDSPDGQAILAIAEALQIGPVPANEILKNLRNLDPHPGSAEQASDPT
ncbi:P-loop NTPase fold protein [uncultured Rhodospira sp.]|uniref:P-loop NTPase fold protein n=1 Tax=uncultured Rhodospira sp. TaxID=1936189 RepID=UPI00261AE0CA|nr:P-loop NTPase fold protein [uncultured Rhodospira sp.]